MLCYFILYCTFCLKISGVHHEWNEIMIVIHPGLELGG